MKVFVNQEEKDISDICSLSKLLEIIDVKSFGIALAVNQNVIPKKSWDNYELSENDNILLIKATQGG